MRAQCNPGLSDISPSVVSATAPLFGSCGPRVPGLTVPPQAGLDADVARSSLAYSSQHSCIRLTIAVPQRICLTNRVTGRRAVLDDQRVWECQPRTEKWVAPAPAFASLNLAWPEQAWINHSCDRDSAMHISPQ